MRRFIFLHSFPITKAVKYLHSHLSTHTFVILSDFQKLFKLLQIKVYNVVINIYSDWLYSWLITL